MLNNQSTTNRSKWSLGLNTRCTVEYTLSVYLPLHCEVHIMNRDNKESRHKIQVLRIIL